MIDRELHPAGEKRRAALVLADLSVADLILCQMTGRAHFDGFSVALDCIDCERANSINCALFVRSGCSRSNTTSFFSRSER